MRVGQQVRVESLFDRAVVVANVTVATIRSRRPFSFSSILGERSQRVIRYPLTVSRRFSGDSGPVTRSGRQSSDWGYRSVTREVGGESNTANDLKGFWIRSRNREPRFLSWNFEPQAAGFANESWSVSCD